MLPGLKFKEIYMIPYRINPDPIFSHQGIPRNLTSPPKNSSICGSHLSKHISELQVVLKEHSWVHQPLVFGQLKHKHHTMRQRSDTHTHTHTHSEGNFFSFFLFLNYAFKYSENDRHSGHCLTQSHQSPLYSVTWCRMINCWASSWDTKQSLNWASEQTQPSQ